MALWPSLVHDNCKLREGSLTIDPSVLSHNASHVLEELQSIDQDLKRIIDEQDLLIIVPSRRLDDPLPVMYEVKETMAAMAICHYAIFSIAVNQILLSLHAADSVETSQIEAEILNQCHRVWMLIEHSRLNKPLGLPVMQAALIFTLESAQDTNTRRNIISAMNDLDSFRTLTNGSWKEAQMIYIARSLRGECSTS